MAAASVLQRGGAVSYSAVVNIVSRGVAGHAEAHSSVKRSQKKIFNLLLP